MAVRSAVGTLALQVFVAGAGNAMRCRTPRCKECGGVIGVYEPLVEVMDGIARETSRAAEPGLSHNPDGSYFHTSCLRRLSPPR